MIYRTRGARTKADKPGPCVDIVRGTLMLRRQPPSVQEDKSVTDMEMRQYFITSAENALSLRGRLLVHSIEASVRRSGHHTLVDTPAEPLAADFQASHQTDLRYLGVLQR